MIRSGAKYKRTSFKRPLSGEENKIAQKMSQTVQLLVVLCLVALAAGRAVKFTDCGSTDGKFVSMDMSPCNADTGPCHIKKGETLTGKIVFQVGSQPVQKMTAKMYVIIHRFKVLVRTLDVCPHLDNNQHCPLKAGMQYSITGTGTVKKLPPFVRLVTMRQYMLNEHKKTLMCAQFQFIIDRSANDLKYTLQHYFQLDITSTDADSPDL